MNSLSLFDLSGKKALVTGGAMGIGRGYAHALAGAGADVAIVDINEKNAKATVEEIKAMGRDSIFVKCDVTDKDQVMAMADAVVDKFGRLDIGVNNAGIGILGDDMTIEKELWQKVIDVNFTGAFYCAQAEAQKMSSQKPMGGKIIFTASMSATIANANASYNASKAGVVMLAKTLAVEWGAFNINVNCISPSYIISELHASTPVAVRDRMRELHPLGSLERVEDLHGPVVFLASDAANFLTGHDLIVDGGHTLNAWMAPLGRVAPPRVSREEETRQLKHDLDVLGVEYDKDVYNADLHPEIGEAFKGMLGL